MWCPVITLCDFDCSIYFTTLCVFFCFFPSLLCRVSMYVCVLVDFIFCSYLMGSCQCFVALLSSSLWIATACDCWLLEQNKMKWNENENDLTTTNSAYVDASRKWRHFRRAWWRHGRRRRGGRTLVRRTARTRRSLRPNSTPLRVPSGPTISSTARLLA